MSGIGPVFLKYDKIPVAQNLRRLFLPGTPRTWQYVFLTFVLWLIHLSYNCRSFKTTVEMKLDL